MDDRRAARPSGSQQLIQARRELFETTHGVEAMMEIPNVADDNGSLFRHPGFIANEAMKTTGVSDRFHLIGQL